MAFVVLDDSFLEVKGKSGEVGLVWAEENVEVEHGSSVLRHAMEQNLSRTFYGISVLLDTISRSAPNHSKY